MTLPSRIFYLVHFEFEKNLSENTLQFYKIDLIQLLNFLKTESIVSTDQIGKKVIKAYVQKLSRFKPRTIKRKVASSKAYLNFLEFEDYILVNPYRKIKVRFKESMQLPTVLSFDEIKRLLLTLKDQKDKVKNQPGLEYGQRLRDLTVFELLFATGMRVSELCGIRKEDINLIDGSILVRGKGNKERMVQVCNDETMKILHDYYDLYKDRIEQVGFFLSAALPLHCRINLFDT